MEMPESGADVLDGVANGKRGCRDVMPLQKFLGKTLARLELRSGLGGPKHGPSPAPEFVHNAEGQRQFRSHHGQVRLQADSQGGNRVQALQVRGYALCVIADAAISRRAVKLRDA